ncbi:hypothetical protein EX30DRAFT_205487 [Ascodesmis nigricans]|uniref:Zn(2)-C6 fungal-type domain-containing protein n=1 Tax=Ascodesmis nigricans TaxID=341454 RepID=A0A4S2MK50_9PEZI|nr:hypothetical protein EX30DRAFT_205487 [Ascodesmis nigricans]
MFSHFSATSSNQIPSSTGTTPTPSGDGPSSATSGHTLSNSAPPGGVPGSRFPTTGKRRGGKRSQVPRACDTCRLYRSKCDNNPQCAPCVARGVKCTNTGQKPAYTLATATQHIEELVEKIRQLEEELTYLRKRDADRARSPYRNLSPHPERTSGESTQFPDQSHGHHEGYRTLGKDLEQLTTPTPFQHNLFNPSIPLDRNSMVPNMSPEFGHLSDPYGCTGSFLGRAREDHYLSVYWDSYHALMPVVIKADVDKLLENLWNEVEEEYDQYTQAPRNRKPAPLLDIIMALCLQYGTNGAIKSSQRQPEEYRSTNAPVEGWDYYNRCYLQVRTELERPTIVTLQCFFLCTMYQLCAGKVNTAYHLMGLTVRMAYYLRIHQEQDPQLDLGLRQLYRRIWWSIYRLEVRLSLELSLPHSIQADHISCFYPTPPQETGSSNTNENHSIMFNAYYTQLHTAVRKIHDHIYRTDSVVHIRSSPQQLEIPPIERIALELNSLLPRITDTWVSSVPNALKFPRLQNGSPFSVDCTSISYDHSARVDHNRQRLFLEASYHMLLLLLHRPFLRYQCPDSGQPDKPSIDKTPTANRLAIGALQHARSLIYLLNQVLTETDHFTGWYPAFNTASAAAQCIQLYLQHYHQLQPLASQAAGISFQNLKETLFISLRIFKEFSPSHPPSEVADQSIQIFLNSISPSHPRGPTPTPLRRNPSSRVVSGDVRSPLSSTAPDTKPHPQSLRILSPNTIQVSPPVEYSTTPPPPAQDVLVPQHIQLTSWPHHSILTPQQPDGHEQWPPQYHHQIDQIFPGTTSVGITQDSVWATGQTAFVQPPPPTLPPPPSQSPQPQLSPPIQQQPQQPQGYPAMGVSVWDHHHGKWIHQHPHPHPHPHPLPQGMTHSPMGPSGPPHHPSHHQQQQHQRRQSLQMVNSQHPQQQQQQQQQQRQHQRQQHHQQQQRPAQHGQHSHSHHDPAQQHHHHGGGTQGVHMAYFGDERGEGER